MPTCCLMGDPKPDTGQAYVNVDTKPTHQSACAQMLTQKRGKIINKHQSLFKGLGKLQGREYHISTDPCVKSKRNPVKLIPHIIRDVVKCELERMEKLGVIVRVTEPTEWVSSMTYIRKNNGRLRVLIRQISRRQSSVSTTL